MLKRFLWLIGTLVAAAALYTYFFAWRSPAVITDITDDEYPLMSWADYSKVAANINPPYTIQRDPYNKGAVLFFGARHSNDVNDPQMGDLQSQWAKFKPTMALVEGRLGFFLPPVMNPVESYGESGLTAALARKNKLPLFSWELSKEVEIAALKRRFTKEQVALFIILRPFLANQSADRAQQADSIVKKLIAERGDRPGIRGAISSVVNIDSIWTRDFQSEQDWRELKFGPALPGYLGELFEYANDVRDFHLLNIVKTFTEQGERVFVSTGWSHTVRIEPAL